MKKIVFFIPLMVAVLASCNKETADGSAQAVTYIEDGLSIVAGAEMSKVTVNIDDERVNPSYMSWEAGDHITVFHNGRSYDFITATSGETALFYPVDANNAITTIVPEQPLIAYYNVTSVAANGTATFSIPAEQTEGELSNKVPLYAYSATTEPVAGRVQLTFNPMASVLEFKVSAGLAPITNTTPSPDSFSYELTKVVLTPASGASGYTAMTSGTVNPATGVVSASETSLSALTYNFASPADIAGEDGRHFQFVIGKCQMDNTGATMDWYKNEYHNYTKTIWASKDIDFTSEYKHIYQPIAQKVVGLGNYTDYYSKFYGNRNSQANYIYYCDDERNLILTGDINLLGGTTPDKFRNTSIPGLTWNLDGKGHMIFNFLCTDEKRLSCLFSNLNADLRNIVFGATGTSARNTINISDTNGKTGGAQAYVGGNFGIVSDMNSGTLENITSYLDWTVTVHSATESCYLGGFVGAMKGGTIRNCKNYGKVRLIIYDGVNHTGSKTVSAAGFVGNSGGVYTIEDCENHDSVYVKGNLSSPAFCSGIIGALSLQCTVAGCTNKGNVKMISTNTTDQSAVNNTQFRVAGIIGRVPANNNPYDEAKEAKITACVNEGEVSLECAAAVKTNQVGGIIADYQVGNTASGCVNKGNLASTVAGSYAANRACWFACWAGGVVNSASVLLGSTVNGTVITTSNYAAKNIWAGNNNPGTLSYISQ